MASLRLTFPEKDEPTVIALTGARLTIGRLPFNTIQIIDRTVSGFHAELISEHGHYRLHDRGSSNGTFVNGQKVADFHLSEPCTITFGTVEAQFSPEAVVASDEAENFPTRSEINAVRKENVELKATVEALREETNALRLARPIENAGAALAVTKEEFDKVVVERETLKEERIKQEEEIARLKTDLAVLKRDRVNLQLAYDGLQREITDLRAQAGTVEQIAIPPKTAAAALAAQAPAPDEEIRVEVPEAESANLQTSAPEIPVEEEISEAPVDSPTPVSVPAMPTPKVPYAPGSPMKPFAPMPKAVPATATTMPVKAPMGLGSGIRPLLAKPVAAAESDASALPEAPTTRLSPRPLPTVKLPVQPTVKMGAVPLPKAGPKGTQKIS